MVRTITALEARQHLGELLEEVFYKQGHFVIKRGQKAMAVVIPLSEYEAFRKQREEDLAIFDEVRGRTKGVPASEVEEDVAVAVKAVRTKKAPRVGNA